MSTVHPVTLSRTRGANACRRATLPLVALLFLSTSASAAPTRVTLVSTGDEARAGAFESSLRELLSRLELTLDVRRGAEATPEGEALAAVEADFSDAEAVKLTVIDWLGRTVLVRRLNRAGNAHLQAEAAAHVVQSVMEELLALTKWKPPVVEPPPLAKPPLEVAEVAEVTEAPPPVKPPSTARWGVDFTAFFGGRNNAPLVPGGGIAVSLARKTGNFRPTLTVLGGYHAPFGAGLQDQLVTVTIETLLMRGLVTLDVLGGDGWRVDVGAGGGADLFLASPRGMVPPSALRRPRADADPVLTAMITGRLAVSPIVDVSLGFSLDFDLWPIHYVASMPRELIYTPAIVRPSLVLGVTFNAFGPDPFWSSK